MENENYEFMPLNRALCLSSVDIDSTESKIDELLHQVTSIAKKQREDVSEAAILAVGERTCVTSSVIGC